MNSIDPELWDAYRKTAFQANTCMGLVTIRIGESTADLDELLRTHNADKWAFITAYNPASGVLPPEENRKRHTQLEADVRKCSLVYFQGEGIGADPQWRPEISLLILGLARDAAIELGATYGQNAIVYGRLGQVAELVGCR